MIGGKRIAIIIPYFGKLPALTQYFFYGCGYNTEVEFLFFTDQDLPYNLPENVIFSKLTIKEFNQLAYNKTGKNHKIIYPYKICDFKPLYGLIFEDYLKDIDFWGYCDLDMILGRISDFITIEILDKYEIITAKPTSLTGNFTLYKNIGYINNLFKQSNAWEIILSSWWRMYSFSEKFKKCGIPVNTGSYYRIRTFFKRNCIENVSIADINAIIKNNSAIKVYYGDLMNSDILHKNRNTKNWVITWEGSSLFDNLDQKNLMYFHFYKLKNNRQYCIPNLDITRTLKTVKITAKKFEVVYQ